MRRILLALVIIAVPLSVAAQDTYNRQILQRINKLRSDLGVAPLKYHRTLDSIAREWVRYIGDSMRHYSDEEAMALHRRDRFILHIDWDQRATTVRFVRGINVIQIGENVAMTYYATSADPTDAAYEGWKASPSHYEAMIDPDYTHAAYAYVECGVNRFAYITVFARVLR